MVLKDEKEFAISGAVGNTAQQCRLGLFQDSDVAGDLEDSKHQHQVDSCACSEVTHSCQQVGCARNRLQYHSSTEAEIISLDAGLRTDGIPALNLWVHSFPNQFNNTKDQVRENSSHGPAETETQNKNEDNEEVQGNSSRDMPELLEEFKDNLVDESVPEHRDAFSSSH